MQTTQSTHYNQNDYQKQQELPNAMVVLILGIASFMVGGPVTAIIALVLSAKDKELYELNPQMYTANSYQNLKIGRILSFIMLGFTALAVFVIIIALLIFLFAASRA